MLVTVLSACLFGVGFDPTVIFRRGDANHDRGVNVSDAIFLNSYLYSGGPAPPCMNEADANDDGHLDGADPVYILGWLYSGGPAPPWPGPTNSTCTHEANAYISCDSGC